ncbi:MAG: hypothetical protein HKN21_07475, partial [Candidatus Eisenbacteria bacterium]|nr:hypothetical protein [Candidatus Eisenbacteria bacterium]
MRFKFLVVLLALAFTVPTLAFAAQGYEIEYRGKGENGQEMVLVRLDSENIHLIPDEDNEVIVGPLAMVMIDHKKQEAFKTTYAEMKAMMSGMSDAMEQMASQAKKAMEEAKKGMTEEQIKAMEQYMPDLDSKSGPMVGKKSKNKFSYKHKGGDGKVAGHSVSRTEVFEGGKLVGKIWTTKDIPFTAVTNAIDNIMGIMPESA